MSRKPVALPGAYFAVAPSPYMLGHRKYEVKNLNQSTLLGKVLCGRLLAVLALAMLSSSFAAAKTHPVGKKQVAGAKHHSAGAKSGKSGKAAKASKAKKTSMKSAAPCHTKHCSKLSRKGQQRIDTARATEIQEALKKAGYLNGDTSGEWDANSQAAMVKYQAENGWQTKVTPDSRALIKLGLGPSHEGLINPETAMTASAISKAVFSSQTVKS